MRILVVDDEVSVARGVQRCLSADGFDVEVAHDGADGLARVRAEPCDLIVLDLLLPSMNGYRVGRGRHHQLRGGPGEQMSGA